MLLVQNSQTGDKRKVQEDFVMLESDMLENRELLEAEDAESLDPDDITKKRAKDKKDKKIIKTELDDDNLPTDPTKRTKLLDLRQKKHEKDERDRLAKLDKESARQKTSEDTYIKKLVLTGRSAVSNMQVLVAKCMAEVEAIERTTGIFEDNASEVNEGRIQMLDLNENLATKLNGLDTATIADKLKGLGLAESQQQKLNYQRISDDLVNMKSSVASRCAELAKLAKSKKKPESNAGKFKLPVTVQPWKHAPLNNDTVWPHVALARGGNGLRVG
jgi:hypothetical protein